MVAAEEMPESAPCMIDIYSVLTLALIFSKGLEPCQKQAWLRSTLRECVEIPPISCNTPCSMEAF